VPIYEYRCAGCDRFFDRLQPFDAEQPPCPSCGGGDVHRLISLMGGLAGSSSAQIPAPVSGGCGGCGAGCACGN
jgi:putative FmdB family regulatory protein